MEHEPMLEGQDAHKGYEPLKLDGPEGMWVAQTLRRIVNGEITVEELGDPRFLREPDGVLRVVTDAETARRFYDRFDGPAMTPQEIVERYGPKLSKLYPPIAE